MPAPLSWDIRYRSEVLHQEGLSAREIGHGLLFCSSKHPSDAELIEAFEQSGQTY